MNGPIPFPDIDPVALQLGPFAVRWYALAYITGLLAGWAYILWLLKRAPAIMTREQVGDFVTWAIVGVILGGRLGYVLFYMPAHFAANPLEIVYVWQGGMSFHGGLLGLTAALLLFSRRHKLVVWSVADLVAAAAPIGLFFGRLANFVNGELYGRTSDVPWAIVFPSGGPAGRHPSQLYEAALEGLLLFAVLLVATLAFRSLSRPGLNTGLFLIGYGAARMIVELFREPDAHLGFIVSSATMGQLLSLPLVLFGAWLAATAGRRRLPT